MSNLFASKSAVSTPSSSDTTAYSPLYKQIKRLLLKSLDEGEWKPGEAIPSEVELAQRFQVSQGTVRKAIDELAADHLLIRRQGKGTYVATHQEARIRFRFLRLTPDSDEPAAPSSRILECTRSRCPTDIAALLHIRTGDHVVNLRRLLTFGDAPVVLDDIWLPGNVFKGMTLESMQRNSSPLYAHFEAVYGVSMVRAEEKIKAVAADAQQGETLRVDTGTPLLFVERVSFTYGDRPMEVRRGLYVTEHFHYRTVLN